MIHVYVPKNKRFAGIAPGSGIVASEPLAPSMPVFVYFEGNVSGVNHKKAWTDRVTQAAGRMHRRYPTSARKAITLQDLADNLVRVGSVDPTTWEVIVDEAQLEVIRAYAGADLGNLLLASGGTKYEVTLDGKAYRNFATVSDDMAQQIALFSLLREDDRHGAHVHIHGGDKPISFIFH